MIRFALPLLAVLSLSLPSCQTVQSARDKLEQMPEAKYQELVQKTNDAGRKGGEKLKELLADRPELLGDVRQLAVLLQDTVQNDRVEASDLIKWIVDRFGDDLGLEEKYQEYIRDGAKAIDAAVGQIRLGIDGALTEREKGLAVALLSGLADGVE